MLGHVSCFRVLKVVHQQCKFYVFFKAVIYYKFKFIPFVQAFSFCIDQVVATPCCFVLGMLGHVSCRHVLKVVHQRHQFCVL
jgi:hypothetical protein